MIYVALPEERKHQLSFYLAMEEYIARHIGEDDCFFMWQVDPTVIFGRNQLIENEVNLDYCRRHGIDVQRRKSGGGCVYADMGNVMLSYITRDESINLSFNRFVNMIALVLCKLGIDARATGRNDIMIPRTDTGMADKHGNGGQTQTDSGMRKVSGTAFYHLAGASVVHGTMLYDTDMRHMVGAITPSDEKLVSKGVESVRQRIALLKDYTDISLEEFKTFVRSTLCSETRTLTSDDVRAIETIQQEYLSDEFIYGKNPAYTTIKKEHINGVGELEVRLEIKNNKIKRINILGDYFLVGDLDGQLLRPLRGVAFDEAALAAAVPEHLEQIIRNLKKEDFIRLILNS